MCESRTYSTTCKNQIFGLFKLTVNLLLRILQKVQLVFFEEKKHCIDLFLLLDENVVLCIPKQAKSTYITVIGFSKNI